MKERTRTPPERESNIDIHRLPQAHLGRQLVEEYSKVNAPSIALPTREHRWMPAQKGIYDGTLKELLAKELSDLRRYTSVPEAAIAKLQILIEKTFPDAD